MLAITVDDVATNAALTAKLGLSFPILADPELATIRAWGVEHQGEGIALPATLVVDRQGRIAWAYVGDAPGDRPLVEQVEAVLDALPAGR